MQVKEIMTSNPACCTPETSLRQITQMMVDHDCGLIPVIENQSNKKPVGTVTDRDIAIRAFATGRNPAELNASDVMTVGIATISPDTSVQKCAEVMEDKNIRRVLVVDESGRCCGIVAQADLAEYDSDADLMGEVVQDISKSPASPNKGKFQQQRKNQSFSGNRSYSSNIDYSPERYYSKEYSDQENESFFSLGTFLPLLAGIGIGYGVKYFYASDQPQQKLSDYRYKKYEPGTFPSGQTNLPADRQRDLSNRSDAFAAKKENLTTGSAATSDRDDKFTSDNEIGRTAGQS